MAESISAVLYIVLHKVLHTMLKGCYIQCGTWCTEAVTYSVREDGKWCTESLSYSVTECSTQCTENYLLCDAKPVQVFRGGCADEERISAAVNQQ